MSDIKHHRPPSRDREASRPLAGFAAKAVLLGALMAASVSCRRAPEPVKLEKPMLVQGKAALGAISAMDLSILIKESMEEVKSLRKGTRYSQERKDGMMGALVGMQVAKIGSEFRALLMSKGPAAAAEAYLDFLGSLKPLSDKLPDFLLDPIDLSANVVLFANGNRGASDDLRLGSVLIAMGQPDIARQAPPDARAGGDGDYNNTMIAGLSYGVGRSGAFGRIMDEVSLWAGGSREPYSKCELSALFSGFRDAMRSSSP